MILRRAFFILFPMICLATAGWSRHAQLDGLQIQPSGEAYESAIRFRGIKNDVGYFDPSRPPPPLEINQTLEQESDENDPFGDGVSPETGRTIWLLIATSVVLGTLYLFVVFGGRLPISFAGDPGDGSGAVRRAKLAAGAATKPYVGIHTILQMKDRRAALVALCKILLARIVAAEGVLLQESWTDRDALRRVPPSYPLRSALQDLVFASERVQFGGRDVSEDEFKSHVAQLRPLWTEAGQG